MRKLLVFGIIVIFCVVNSSGMRELNTTRNEEFMSDALKIVLSEMYPNESINITFEFLPITGIVNNKYSIYGAMPVPRDFENGVYSIYV